MAMHLRCNMWTPEAPAIGVVRPYLTARGTNRPLLPLSASSVGAATEARLFPVYMRGQVVAIRSQPLAFSRCARPHVHREVGCSPVAGPQHEALYRAPLGAQNTIRAVTFGNRTSDIVRPHARKLESESWLGCAEFSVAEIRTTPCKQMWMALAYGRARRSLPPGQCRAKGEVSLSKLQVCTLIVCAGPLASCGDSGQMWHGARKHRIVWRLRTT